MLDLIITRDDVIDLISDVTASLQCISDHSLVACTIKMRRENQAKHTYCYRNIKNIDLNTFKSNIRLSRLYDTSLSLLLAGDYTDVFDNEVLRLLDEAALIRTAVKYPALNDCRWMSDEVHVAKWNFVDDLNVVTFKRVMMRTDEHTEPHNMLPHKLSQIHVHHS